MPVAIYTPFLVIKTNKQKPFFWFLVFSAKGGVINASSKPIIFQIIPNIGWNKRHLLNEFGSNFWPIFFNPEKSLQTHKPEMI